MNASKKFFNDCKNFIIYFFYSDGGGKMYIQTAML